MKHSWNRRDFIVKPLAGMAAWPLLGRCSSLFAQTAQPAAKKNTPPQIIYRTLGKTGISLPIVSMGVMNADVPGLVRRAYDVGMRHFDTAAVYQQGRNEEMLGRMIKEMGVRDKVTIATKAFVPDRNPGLTQPQAKARLLEIFEGSLKRLQMDYVDILYYHAADTLQDVNASGPIEALTQLKKEGKARFIAVSTHQPELILNEAMRLGVYDVVLIIFNYTMAGDTGLLNAIDRAAKKGIGLIAMKTQAGGTGRPDSKLNRPLTPASQTALLKWVMRHESITTAIPGFSTYEHLEQDFSVAHDLAYSPAEREFLSDKSAAVDAEFCKQCGECRPDCPLQADIPKLMRSHMYAVQYSNRPLAGDTLAAIAAGKGLDACSGCESCQAMCRNSVNIGRKIEQLKQISAAGVLNV